MTETLEKYSFSKIQSFMRCPHKHYLQYILRLFPTKKAAPLSLGGCMAEGLGAYRATGSLSQAQEAFVKQWAEDGRILATRSVDDEMRSVERGLEILEEYTKFYPNDPIEMIQPEIQFEEVIEDFIYRGRIDAVWSDGRRVSIVEDKTASRLGPSYFAELLGGWQVLWYMGIAKLLGLFNTIKSNQTPHCTANALYIHANKFRFEREVTTKSNKTLDQGMLQISKWVKAIRYATKTNNFPMADSDRCHQFGKCEYKQLCASTEERVRENIINVDFEYREGGR